MSKVKKLYVISDIQKHDYERIFNKTCTVLTKGADFSNKVFIKKNYHKPLQFVYTGNLGNNRWKSLLLIADALVKINQEEIKGQLKIYTASPLTSEIEKALNKENSSIIMGSVPASVIPKIQRKADVLIHVEAFDSLNVFKVRQSFSTKIVDYLKLASPILVIGPQEIASVNYFKMNDIGVVITREKEVVDKIIYIIENSNTLFNCGKRLYEVGKKNHDIRYVHDLLKRDFENLMNYRDLR